MEVKRNVMFSKAGGTAGKESCGYKINIPADMIRELGISRDNRSVILKCEDKKIIIQKA